MAASERKRRTNWAAYHDRRRHSLTDLSDEPVGFSLTEELKHAVLSGKRRRRLKNISIKLDPVHILAIQKIATMKSIPYQTCIRHWISESLKRESSALAC